MAANVSGDPMELALETLSDYIKTNLTGLASISNEWPYANQKLVFPSLTITLNGSPKRMPEMPYETSVTTPDVDGKVLVNEVVASWDAGLQLDLWCRDKLQRRQFTDQLIALFNSQETDMTGNDKPDGLSLQCSSMFNEWIRYEIDTVTPMDDEAAAQRHERREKIAVLVNFREVRQRTYYAITKLQVQSAIDPSVNTADDTATGTDQTIIFGGP